jgi:uncharacterized protein (TIGR02145 family)
MAAVLTVSAFSQSPEKMSYQAVIRDASNNLVLSKEIGIQISILQGSTTGAAVYVETQEPTTNANGLVSLEIGNGTIKSGSFSTILWDKGTYYLKTEIDVNGGSNYTITGVSQLLSVPYALHAKTADSVTQNLATKEYADVLQAKIDMLELANDGFIDSRDGIHYDVVKIGNQIWMAENLKYLPRVNAPEDGSEEDANGKYYYVYDYIPVGSTDIEKVTDAKKTINYLIYGVLYNWNAALNGESGSNANPSNVQGVCPAGWHLPSQSEWNQLFTFLEGESVAGGKLKELGTSHWSAPNTGASNKSDFSALPGGARGPMELFYGMGTNGEWWTSREYPSNIYNFIDIYYTENKVNIYSNMKDYSYSVRCVKD